MEFNTASPIWMQLVEEFSRRIVTGAWAVGDKMPGVREVAAELGVNPNTAQRAFAELERRNLCRSERATGRFVTTDETRINDLRAELAGDAADDFIRALRGLRMGREHAQSLLESRWDNYDRHTTDVSDSGGS